MGQEKAGEGGRRLERRGLRSSPMRFDPHPPHSRCYFNIMFAGSERCDTAHKPCSGLLSCCWWRCKTKQICDLWIPIGGFPKYRYPNDTKAIPKRRNPDFGQRCNRKVGQFEGFVGTGLWSIEKDAFILPKGGLHGNLEGFARPPLARLQYPQSPGRPHPCPPGSARRNLWSTTTSPSAPSPIPASAFPGHGGAFLAYGYAPAGEYVFPGEEADGGALPASRSAQSQGISSANSTSTS